MHPLERIDLFVGLTGLTLSAEPVSFGDGIYLTETHAKFLSPLTLVNTSPPPANSLKVRPSYWQSGSKEVEISAQLLVPKELGNSFENRFEIARFIVLILRLWSDPGIGFHVLSSHKFDDICDRPDDDRPVLIPIETQSRYFPLGTVDPTSVGASLKWAQENWKVAYRLYLSSAEFRLAADSLDAGQFVPNHALALV